MPTLEATFGHQQNTDGYMRSVFTDRIIAGLRKKAVISPSTWARTFRKMGAPIPGPWKFDLHPWLLAMHDSEDDLNIGQKSSQMGYSETVLNICFYYIDIKRMSCLYLMPTKTPDASDFSASRFSGALDASEHLSALFTHTNNIGHKRAGNTSLYVRGMRSRSSVKSIPTPVIIFDELDEMPPAHIPLAEARADGQFISVNWKISTPTIPGRGINDYYERSTKQRFYFKCPSCDRFIDLQFPRNIQFPDEDPRLDLTQITADRYQEGPNLHYKCHECDARLYHKGKKDYFQKSEWVADNRNGTGRGWYVNHMYSCMKAGVPAEFISRYYRARLNPAAEQEFYNSDLGLPHIVAGANVDDAMIDRCRGDHKRLVAPYGSRLRTMGIDVGRYFHIIVTEWDLSDVPPGAAIGAANHYARAKVVAQYKVVSKEQVIDEIGRWSPRSTVIDSLPEHRVVKEIADYFYGKVKLCIYGNIRGEVLKEIGHDHQVVVARTPWLDLTLGRFMKGTVTVPNDIDVEYREQIKAPVRVYRLAPNGETVAAYETARDDHYAHAQNYAEIALMFAAGQDNYNINAAI